MSETNEFAQIRNADTSEVLVRLFGPGRSVDGLSSAMRVLTHQVTMRMPDAERSGGGVFGGEYGYGVAHDNDVFSMHPYCWCDSPDCPWCAACACKEDPQSCAWCRGEHRWGEKGALPPNEWPHFGAPHFWHKPTGLRVWWYKYIGRDMDVHPGAATDVEEIFNACLASIGAPPLREAWGEYLAAEEKASREFQRAMEYWSSEEGCNLMQRMMDDGAVNIFSS